MNVALVDAPNSLLLTAPDRTLLHDLEGTGEQLVMYVQAATHGTTDEPSADAWRTRMLDHLTGQPGQDTTR